MRLDSVDRMAESEAFAEPKMNDPESKNLEADTPKTDASEVVSYTIVLHEEGAIDLESIEIKDVLVPEVFNVVELPQSYGYLLPLSCVVLGAVASLSVAKSAKPLSLLAYGLVAMIGLVWLLAAWQLNVGIDVWPVVSAVVINWAPWVLALPAAILMVVFMAGRSRVDS